MPRGTTTILRYDAPPAKELVLIGRTPELYGLAVKEGDDITVEIPIPTAFLPQCRDVFHEALKYADCEYDTLAVALENETFIPEADRWQRRLVSSLLEGDLEVILVEPTVGVFDIRVQDTHTAEVSDDLSISVRKLLDVHAAFDKLVTDLQQRPDSLHDRTAHL